MTEFVIITGTSGAGRSTASDVFEDLGWFVVDNLPVELLPKFVELAAAPGSTTNRIALVIGTNQMPDRVVSAIDELRDSGDRVRVLFLEASTDVLVRRYESTKRRHPHGGEEERLAQAIESERDALQPVRELADVVVDTSELNVHGLRARVRDLFGDDLPDAGMQITLLSFGFKHGLPLDVDLVFDCRFLPNPHWDDDLRPRTGLDAEVRDYVMASDAAAPFLDKVDDLLDLLVPAYAHEGKAYLTIAVGCTGGHHRSVAIAEELGERLRSAGHLAAVKHRDIDR